jgi:hypothetical protein
MLERKYIYATFNTRRYIYNNSNELHYHIFFFFWPKGFTIRELAIFTTLINNHIANTDVYVGTH